jgi:hypothetical protein
MSLMLQLIGNPFSPGGEPYSHTLSGASEKCTEALSGRLGKKMYKCKTPPPPTPRGTPRARIRAQMQVWYGHHSVICCVKSYV